MKKKNDSSLQEQTDEELLLSLADGETKALDILYLRHSGKVLAFAKKRGLSEERADDVLQIVFLQLHRKKHLYDPKHRALAWIFVITRSELKDYRNREIKDFQEFDDSLSQTEGLTPSLEMKDEARGLLSELRERDQDIVKMRYLDEMEYAEIAQALDESESNIRQIVSRSVRLLKGLAGSRGGRT